ncbi:MAG: hypothetical protein JHC41_03955 [Nitrosopumilus sp.]|nr:hypothetical protein [Nitrosopumilus sp.]
MKHVVYLSVFALIFTLSVFAIPVAHAVTVAAATSGDWDTGATWVGGAVPGIGVDKIIPAGITVTVSTLVSNSDNINNYGTINITSGGTIHNVAGTISNNNGTITNSGTLTNTSGTISNFYSITNNLTGHINNNSGTITNSGTINKKGDMKNIYSTGK